MAINEFKPFATGGGANVLPQADYDALAARTAGFSSGTAKSQDVNKVLRQSSIIAAVVAQFISDITGKDSLDDGATATLLANLKNSVRAQSNGVVGASRKLFMSVAAAAVTATLTADEIVVESALGGLSYRLANFSKTLNLSTVGAGGMDTGSAPASGFVGIYAIYNPTSGNSALLAVNATSASVPNVYGGANMPSGYTASALVSVWPTNGSGQFVVGMQRERDVSIANNTVLSTSTTQASLTSFSISAAVPRNAVACRGDFTISSSSAGAGASGVICGSPSEIGRAAISATSATASAATTMSFPDIQILNAQTLYYRASVSSGTLTFIANIVGYSF